MQNFKKLPMAMSLVGLGAAMSFAEIKVNDNLALSGFLDMSVSGEANDSTETLNASFDQFELDFMYKFGDKISARADINAHPGTAVTHLNASTGLSVTLEQGFVTYANGPLSFSTGRFLSSSGFEAAEPTGLYQFSVSKNLSNAYDVVVYGGYQDGVNVAYSTPLFGLYGAVVSDLWNTGETDVLKSPGFEGQVTLTPAEGVTAKVAYLHQIYDEGDDFQGLLNAWASYAIGPVTLAGEYNWLNSWEVGASTEETGHGWLAMANYKVNDLVAATVRYSGIVFPDIGEGQPDQEVTFSPSLALSPNWLALAEVKYHFGNDDVDSKTQYAVEGLFSF
jgi:hypothetical protein